MARWWRIAFAIGLVGVIVSSVWVFGFATLTTVVGVATIVVALLNAFVVPEGNGGSTKPSIAGSIRRFLRVTAYTRIATVALFAAIGAEAVYARLRTVPVPPAPFTIAYYYLEGPMIDFLVREERLDPSFDDLLGRHPYLHENTVLKSLRELVNGYSRPLEPSERLYRSNGKDESEVKLGREMKVFLGDDAFHVELELTAKDVASLQAANGPWKLELWRNALDPFESLEGDELKLEQFSAFFWRFVDAEDLQRIATKRPARAAALFATIADPLPASRFAIAEIRHTDDCVYPYWKLYLMAPPIKLRIAVIQNVTRNNVQLGPIAMKTSGNEKLRDLKEEGDALQRATAFPETALPTGVLKPDEAVVVPSAILLEYAPDALWAKTPLRTADERHEVASPLIQKNTIELPVEPSILAHPKLTADRVKRYLAEARSANELAAQTYVFGPSSILESVDADGHSYPARQPVESDIEHKAIRVRAGEVVNGSCPYVYVRAASTSPWEKLGPILYGLDRVGREGLDAIELRDFDGSLQIREEEPETTWLDELYVRETTASGDNRMLAPDLAALRERDGDYVRLTTGDSLTVRFAGYSPRTGSRYTVVARGYYIPR
jgi:hypothetical protein